MAKIVKVSPGQVIPFKDAFGVDFGAHGKHQAQFGAAGYTLENAVAVCIAFVAGASAIRPVPENVGYEWGFSPETGRMVLRKVESPLETLAVGDLYYATIFWKTPRQGGNPPLELEYVGTPQFVGFEPFPSPMAKVMLEGRLGFVVSTGEYGEGRILSGKRFYCEQKQQLEEVFYGGHDPIEDGIPVDLGTLGGRGLFIPADKLER